MTDRELDSLVAQKIFLWPQPVYITDELHDPLKPIYGWRECFLSHDIDETCDHSWRCGSESYFAAPQYSSDLEAAWSVIDKIKSLTLYNGHLHSTRDPWVLFCFELSGRDYNDGFNLHAFWNVTPKLICESAIKCLGVKIL